MMARNPEILFITEYFKNVLYFATVRQGKTLKNTSDIHYFSIDDELVYENYYSDFGPLNLGCVYKYCKILNEKLRLYSSNQIIIHYTSVDPKRKTNAAFLLGCYGVLFMNMTPIEAMKPLVINGQTYRSFQDATLGDSTHTITILDCLNAIKKACALGFFNFGDFDCEEYQRLDKIQGGDLNWIVPGKYLAFIGPVDYSVSLYHPPEMYVDYFLDNNVKIVIRLNKRMYDGKAFSSVGIVHYDLFFPDGSCPPRHILFKFLQISEEAEGAIAVHCKAGLGRTGSLIGCYLIKHYRMSAHEAIGWMRICRPGSVIGHQQSWLEQLEPWLIKQGNIYRKRKFQDIDKFPSHVYGVYSIAEKKEKHKSKALKKVVSPPPPIHRQTRSEMTPPVVRPQASKVRGAPNKIASSEEQCKWNMKPMKPHTPQKISSTLPSSTSKVLNKEDMGDLSNGSSVRRGFAAGEPRNMTRPRSPTSRANNFNGLQAESAKITNKRNVNIQPQVSQVPTYNTSQGPIVKTLKEARNYLIRTSIHKDKREKELKSALVVTAQIPQAHRLPPHPSDRSRLTSNTPFVFSSIEKGSTQPSSRRLLGRSPSPSPSPSPTRGKDRSRATNTATAQKPDIEATGCALNEAIDRLKWTLCHKREGSVGATSLGAPRNAPRAARTNARATSVRSDEYTIATQGDMLNSIKFRRQLRESIKATTDEGTDKPNFTEPAHKSSNYNDLPHKPSINDPSRKPSINEPVHKPSINDTSRKPSIRDPPRKPSISDPARKPSTSDPPHIFSFNRPSRKPSISDPAHKPSINGPSRKPSISDFAQTFSFNGPARKPSFNDAARNISPSNYNYGIISIPSEQNSQCSIFKRPATPQPPVQVNASRAKGRKS